MAASYPNSVKTFATRSAGQTIDPSHVNDLQDEVSAIEDGLLNGTAPVTSSNLTVTGALNSTVTIGAQRYRFPSSGGSTGQVLTCISTSGSTMTLEWRAAQTLSSATGSTVGSLTVSSSGSSAPAANTLFSNSLIRAWAVFSTTPSLTAAFNVSSVVASGSTAYDFSFGTNLPSSDYVVVALSRGAGSDVGFIERSRASSGFRLGSTHADMPPGHVLVVGG